MSEFLDSPYEPGSPEDNEFQRAKMRGFGLALTNLPVGAVTQILPARKTEEGAVKPAIPGLFTSIYGGLGSIIPRLSNYAFGTNIPDAPGAQTALESYRDTSRLAGDIIPHMSGTSPEEKTIEEASQAAGGVMLPIPGSVLSGLPKALSIPAHAIVPTTKGMAIAAPAMAGLSIALSPEAQGTTTQEGQPTPFNFEQPQLDAGRTTPTPFTFDQGSAPAPDFGQQTGESKLSFGEGLAGALAVGAATWATLRYGGRGLVAASDMLRGGKQAAIDAFNQNLDRLATQPGANLTGTMGEVARGEAPLPGLEPRSLGTRMSQYWLDKNALLNSYYRQIADTPDAASELQAALGTVNNNQSMSRRMHAQFRTGVDVVTGDTMPSLTEWGQRIQSLPEGYQQMANIGMWAKDELNTRKTLFDRAIREGKPISNDRDFRVNFYDESSDTLRAAVQLAERIPEVRGVMDTAWSIGRRNLEIALKRGYITNDDFARVSAERPHYIPTVDEEGRIQHIFEQRDVTPFSGVQNIPTTAWSALIQHQDALYRDMATNEWRRALLLQADKFQRANPNEARVINEKFGPDFATPADADRQRAVSIRTASGKRTFLVDNTSLYRAIQGPPAQMNLFNNAANASRRIYQSGVTGPLAAVTGQRFFAPINLIRTTLQMGPDRPVGTYGGLIDRALQRAGLPGYRGFDPTTPFGVLFSTGADLTAGVAKSFGDALMTPANPATQAIRAIKGDAWTDALAQRMSQYFERSTLAQQRALGIGGQGAQGGIELQTAELRGSRYQARNPLAEQVPGIMGGTTIPGTRIPIPSTVAHSYINLRSLIRDIHETISNGAQSYYFRLNEANPRLSPNRLAYETMQLIGDPGTAGAGRVAQRLAANVPYFNVSMQDAARMFKLFRDNPIAFSTGTIMTLALPSLASNLSAIISGPEHVKHMEEGLTTQQREANVTLYHGPGTDPADHTEISLPQRWRPLYPMIHEMISTAIGAWDAHADEGTLNRTLDMLGDIFSHHISNSTGLAAEKGAGEFLGFTVAAPPGMQFAANLTGKRLRPDATEMINSYLEGQPVMNTLATDIVPARPNPGESIYDNTLSNDDGRTIQALMSSLFGIAGNAYTMYHNFTERAGQGLADRVAGIWTDAKQNLMDTSPWGNIVWRDTLKQSTKSPLEESLDKSWTKISATAGMASDVEKAGLTRAGGLPLLPSGDTAKVPDDPVMRQMYSVTSNYAQLIGERIMPQIHDLKSQLSDVSRGPLSAEVKRQQVNALAAKIQDRYEMLGGYVNNLETALGKIVGAPVDIRSVDWTKGPEQFKR